MLHKKRAKLGSEDLASIFTELWANEIEHACKYI